MILPAVRERLEGLLRHPSMEGALAELRANAGLVSITGLHDVAKALVAVYLTHALRRPAFLLRPRTGARNLWQRRCAFSRAFFPVLQGMSRPFRRLTACPGKGKARMPTFWSDEPRLCSGWWTDKFR